MATNPHISPNCSVEAAAAGALCNVFGLQQYDNRTSFFGGHPQFPQGVGYAVVIGGGAFFALFTSFLVWVDEKFGGTVYSNSHFNTCGRTIRTGLIACDVVSHWSWNSVFLFIPTLFYDYGWSPVVWNSSGASVAIFLFGIVGLKLKERAPTATTIMQVLRCRWGTVTHIVFLCLMLLTNWFVTTTNILGGAQVIAAMTGMNVYASSVLIPLGIVLYTAFGGLKATFTSSYLHTAIIMVSMMIFAFRIYASSGLDGNIGSMKQIYENVSTMALVRPVGPSGGLAGNKHGSYFTFWSAQGLMYGIYAVTSSAPLVFNDQAYWQTSVAAKPMAVIMGYALSGVLWFPINYVFGIALGAAAVGLDLPLAANEVSNSLVVPAAAQAVLGTAGGALVIVIIFMATTSAVTAELVGVSSLLTYDIWKIYIRPKASSTELLLISRLGVTFWGGVGAASVCIVIAAGFNFNWFILVLGVFTPAAVPAFFCALFWDRVSGVGAIFSAVVGNACSIFVWLYVADRMVGDVSIDSTEYTLPIAASSVTSLGSAAVAIVVWAYLFPVKFDWDALKTINQNMDEELETGFEETGKHSMEGMLKAKKFAYWWGGVFTVLTLVAWPLLALPAGDWSEGYFVFNVILAIIWGMISSIILIFMPIWESRKEVISLTKNLVTWSPVTDKSLLGEILPSPHLKGPLDMDPKMRDFPAEHPTEAKLAAQNNHHGVLPSANEADATDDTAHGGNHYHRP